VYSGHRIGYIGFSGSIYFLPSFFTYNTDSALLRRIELLEEAGLQYDHKGRKDKER
jgi:hypothetical protein